MIGSWVYEECRYIVYHASLFVSHCSSVFTMFQIMYVVLSGSRNGGGAVIYPAARNIVFESQSVSFLTPRLLKMSCEEQSWNEVITETFDQKMCCSVPLQ